jgi:hypothetical protein
LGRKDRGSFSLGYNDQLHKVRKSGSYCGKCVIGDAHRPSLTHLPA